MSARIRRRSAAVSLSAVMLGGSLAACEPKPVDPPASEQTMKVYASADECASSGGDWNTCNSSAAAAAAEHVRTAPQFASQADCNRETGGECAQHVTSGGSHIFLPLMAGFMMGQMMNRGYVAHPIYGGRDGGYYSGQTRVADGPDFRRPDQDRSGGGSGGGGGGANARSLPREVAAPVDSRGEIARSGSTKRGGFGRTSSYRGSGG